MTPKDNQEIAEWCEPEPVLGTNIIDSQGGFWTWDCGRGSWEPRTDYDLNACALFEAVADKQGLLYDYMKALFQEFFGGDGIKGAPWTMIAGAALFAKPAQRVKAILAVMKEAKA